MGTATSGFALMSFTVAAVADRKQLLKPVQRPASRLISFWSATLSAMVILSESVEETVPATIGYEVAGKSAAELWSVSFATFTDEAFTVSVNDNNIKPDVRSRLNCAISGSIESRVKMRTCFAESVRTTTTAFASAAVSDTSELANDRYVVAVDVATSTICLMAVASGWVRVTLTNVESMVDLAPPVRKYPVSFAAP